MEFRASSWVRNRIRLQCPEKKMFIDCMEAMVNWRLARNSSINANRIEWCDDWIWTMFQGTRCAICCSDGRRSRRKRIRRSCVDIRWISRNELLPHLLAWNRSWRWVCSISTLIIKSGRNNFCVVTFRSQCVWRDGECPFSQYPTLNEIRERVKSSLRTLRQDHLRYLNPTPYKVCIPFSQL